MSGLLNNQITVSADDAIARIKVDKQQWNNWVQDNSNAFVDFRNYQFNNLDADFFVKVYFPKVSFEGAIFDCEVRFYDAVFLENTVFDNAVFNHQVWFSQTKFKCEANFSSATFTKTANFDSAIFTENANFNSATFTENAYFHSATFTKTADFRLVTFIEEANFSTATFTENAYFYSATFTETAYFHSATFTKTAYFNSATFTENADFYSATFTENANFISATFTKNANFRLATFTKTANFYSATFTKTANFYSTFFKNNVFFTEVKFLDSAVFQAINFEGVVEFENSKFSDIPDLRKTKISHHFSCEGMRVYPKYEKAGWFGLFQKVKNKDDADKLRRLKELAAIAQDHDEEQQFFALELKAKRFYTINEFNLITNYLYEWFGNFGLSILKPTVWLFFIWFVFGLYYQNSSNFFGLWDHTNPYGFSLSNIFAFLSSTNLVDILSEQGIKLDYAAIISTTHLQTFLSFPFIFLIGLALRNKFKI